MHRFKFQHSQKGIALLIVLVFMQIFALLGLYSILECVLLQKTSEGQFRYLQTAAVSSESHAQI